MALSQPRQAMNTSGSREGEESGDSLQHPMEGKKAGSGGNVAGVVFDKLVLCLLQILFGSKCWGLCQGVLHVCT